MALAESPRHSIYPACSICRAAAIQPTCLIVCVPSAFRQTCLLANLAAGFDKAVPREAEAAEHRRPGCHYIFTRRQKQRAKAPSGIGPDGAGTQRRFLGSHDSASSRAECVIAGSITRVSTGRLLRHSSQDSARGSRGGAREVMNILQLGLRASLQGCTFPAATRTATIGRCSAIRAGGSAGASTSMAGS